MKIYKVEVWEPLADTDPNGKYKAGDIGIYSEKVKDARALGAILRIRTRLGVTYADPNKIIENSKFIYRHMAKEEPMKLYIVEPNIRVIKLILLNQSRRRTGMVYFNIFKQWALH